ncbi:MAG: acyl carrier protein [Vicinamibacterales bacterium]
MTPQEIRSVLIELLQRIAPELDAAALDPGAPLRETIDLDSMDFLNFVTSIHQRLGVDVPEADYARLFTLDGAVDYISSTLVDR